MLKRDHPKFKGNWISAIGASKSKCRETHRVKEFRRLRKKSYVEQVAEANMLKRDDPKFKGNWISATGASKSECRETLRVKAFHRLRKKSDVEQVAQAYMLKRDHPEIQRQLDFGNRGIEVGMPRNSPSQSVSPFAEEV